MSWISDKSRSLFLPDGSPINPVAPPIKPIGFSPNYPNLANINRDNKFPKCKDSAVGSKPQYTDPDVGNS